MALLPVLSTFAAPKALRKAAAISIRTTLALAITQVATRSPVVLLTQLDPTEMGS
jgi:hypothetical protein